jgi:Protein of unknown function (DUF3089)
MRRHIRTAPRAVAALFAMVAVAACGSSTPLSSPAPNSPTANAATPTANAATPTANAATPTANAASASTAPVPPPTDYTQAKSWLAVPTSIDKPVDVFYMAPTEYTRASASASIVGAVDDPRTVAGEKAAFSREATAFAPVANIYAPYYRQADAAARAALPQAEQVAIVAGAPTQDGIAAFDYYITHENKGRPFFLAGHSLGSNVIANLLASYMPTHPDVYRRMIAAYAVGYSITPDYLAQNPTLKFATGRTDTGVIVSWNTEAPTIGGPNPVLLPGGLAINPITWVTTEARATAGQNLGSIVLNNVGAPATDAAGNISRVLGLVDAQVDKAKGVVIVTTVPVQQYSPGGPGQFPMGVYHGYDIPFFFFDLRQNAADRAASYLATR